MVTYLSPNGLPLSLKWTNDIGAEAMGIYKAFISVPIHDYEKRLDVMDTAMTLQSKVGNPFYLALHGKMKLTPAARSLLIQYANALASKGNVPNTGIESWMLMLAPSDDAVYFEPNWTDTERKVLDTVSQDGNVGVLRRFIDGPGLNKYFELLRLWLMPVAG